MGRKSRSRALSLWMNGEHVGQWRIPTRGPMELHYATSWVGSESGRPLSLSLPIPVGDRPIKGDVVANYFENLLPESEPIRRRVAARFQLASTDAFELLSALGRDCVGAVQLLPEGDKPTKVHTIQGRPLKASDIEDLLKQTVAPTALARVAGDVEDDDAFRVSLAGMQEKTALLQHNGQWMLPHGSTPSTHILKLPMGLVGGRKIDMSHSAENEWLCARLVAAFGLPIARCEIGHFGDQKVLVVERFDRQLHASGKWWMRLPQEDFCQVHGLPSLLKYESDGGPGLERLAGVLANSVNAKADLETLLAAQILFWMLAATDGHAKNFSIRLLADGRYLLTPLYDVLSMWPVMGNGASQVSWHKAKLAMSVRGKSRHYALRSIQRRHFNAMAKTCLWGDSAEPIIERLLVATPKVLASTSTGVPKGFPQIVLDRVLEGLRVSADRLAAMPAT